MKRGNTFIIASFVIILLFLVSSCFIASNNLAYKVSECEEGVLEGKNESIEVTKQGNTIRIKQNMINFCGQDVVLEKTVTNGFITIMEKITGQETLCKCVSTVTATISPLTGKQNKLRILKELSEGEIELVYEGDI